jgi:glycosyltransferase involved in cell wall biosynthesis
MREMLVEANSAGWSVSFFSLHCPSVDWSAARSEIPWEIEIISGRGAPGLADFMEDRREYYDLIFVSRPDNMEFFRAILRERPHLINGTRLVYDAEALFAARTIIKQSVEDSPIPADEAEDMIAEEVALATEADAIVCVSDLEADVFRARLGTPVHVLSHPTEPRRDASGFTGRDGFLFVGRLLEHDSPNWRGLSWFLCEVWPLIRAQLPSATLVIAGHLHTDHDDLEGPGVRLIGAVEDLQPLYDSARVFLAPIRFAAGVPIKILEATAAGLPTAATPLMARQLNWTPGVEIAAEGEHFAFATAAVELHTNEAKWSGMRTAAMERLALEHGAERFRKVLRAVLEGKPPVEVVPTCASVFQSCERGATTAQAAAAGGEIDPVAVERRLACSEK